MSPIKGKPFSNRDIPPLNRGFPPTPLYNQNGKGEIPHPFVILFTPLQSSCYISLKKNDFLAKLCMRDEKLEHVIYEHMNIYEEWVQNALINNSLMNECRRIFSPIT